MKYQDSLQEERYKRNWLTRTELSSCLKQTEGFKDPVRSAGQARTDCLYQRDCIQKDRHAGHNQPRGNLRSAFQLGCVILHAVLKKNLQQYKAPCV